MQSLELRQLTMRIEFCAAQSPSRVLQPNLPATRSVRFKVFSASTHTAKQTPMVLLFHADAAIYMHRWLRPFFVLQTMLTRKWVWEQRGQIAAQLQSSAAYRAPA